MARLLPLLLIALGMYLLLKHLRSLPPAERRSKLITWAVYAAIGILVLAVVSGRIHWLGALVAAALAGLRFSASALFRLLPLLNVLRRSKAINDPVFRTAYLELRLALQNGAISGQVLQGEYQGRELHSLNDDEGDRLEATLKDEDRRGYYLLRVYRSRHRSHQDQHAFQEATHDHLADPSVEEARLILGLEQNYKREDINRAFKQLIQKLHPDRGGNDYLASRINRARDILLKTLNN